MTDEDLLRPAAVATRPTAAGRVLLGATLAALALGAAGFGVVFALVAALGGAFAVVAAVAARRQVAALRLRPPGPATATAHERFPLAATVERTGGGGASSDLVASFRDGRDGRRVAGFLPRICFGAPTLLEVLHPPLRRGRHPQQALELESSGPLGLVRCRARFDLPHEVLVLPRLGGLRGLDRDLRRMRDVAAPASLGRAGGEEYHGLRAWREGEGLRRVHWKASARRGRLVVRELRGTPQPPVHVVLVAATAPEARGRRADFEGAVSLAATLVEHHVHRDHTVRLTIVGREVRTFAGRRGRSAVLPALRALAEFEAVPAAECRGLAGVPRDGRPGERTFVARADGVGGAPPETAHGARPWRVLDVADPRIGATFVRGRRASTLASPAPSPDAGAVGPADVVRRADRALRVVAWIAIVAATLAIAVAALLLLLPGEGSEGLGRGEGGRIALLAVLLAVAGFQAVSVAVRGHDRSVLVRVLWTTQSMALVGAALARWIPVALLVPVVVSLLLVGLSLSDAATLRETLVRALRNRTALADDPRAVGRRAWSGAALAVPVLALATLLLPVATHGPEILRNGWSRLTGDDDSPGPGGRGGRGGGGGANVVIDPTAHGFGDADLENQLLLEIVPSQGGRPAGNLGPLYLRGSTLVEVDDRGRWIDPDVPPPLVRDRDDGREDGWCVLRTPAPAEGDFVDLAMRQAHLSHGPTGLAILHAPPGTVAVERGRILHEAEGVILSDRERRHPIVWRQRVLREGRLPMPTARTPHAVRDARALEFPVRHPSAAALAAEARDATEGHTNDLARVRAVVRHLREGYAYERLPDSEDLAVADEDPLERFVTARRGSCVHFAQAAALMLRSRGLPARVATGLLVREWNPERGLYRAFGRDYHAWVEVDFEGCGWVVFDATPVAPGADSAEDAAAAAARARGGDSAGGFDAFLRTLGDGVVRTVAAAREHAWPWGPLAVVAGVLVALLLPRRRRAPGPSSPADAADVPSWARLLARLADRGLRRAPTETALEFAARVVASEGDRLAAFVPLTLRQQAARYGALPLTDADDRAIRELTGTLLTSSLLVRSVPVRDGPHLR